MKAAGQRPDGTRDEKVHRNLIVSRIFGGRRKDLERAIRDANQKSVRPIEFPNGTWLAAQYTSGGTVLTIRGERAAETIRALNDNTVEKMIAGMRIAGTPVRMN